ncbi:MAG: hypothetical protein COB60_08320 [Flavobacteriaceae bacterium]|nr:MAG: hypothetical protein COB60_08320 [Flavobacteriaceae bacterium]
MKIFTAAIFLYFCYACTPQKYVLNLTETIHMPSNTQIKDGYSTVSVIQHKKAVLKKDKFGIGYVTLENAEGSLVKFEYKKQAPQNTADAHYSEIIYIHLAKDFSEFKLHDTTLQQAQILFGRFCYCKGKTGFYKVEQGELSAKMWSKNNLVLVLNFSMKQVPHLISSIQESIDLKYTKNK